MSKFLGVAKDELTPNQVNQLQVDFKVPPISGSLSRSVTQAIREMQLYQDYGAARDDSNPIRTLTIAQDVRPQGFAGGVFGINSPLSTKSLQDFANFAGQTLGSAAPAGWVFHHYTDGELLRIDNVGSGRGLRIHNAQNPSRRPDKDPSYVGDGPFIYLSTQSDALRTWFMSKDLEMIWQTKGSDIISGVDSTINGFCHTLRGYNYQPLHTAFVASGTRIMYVGEAAAGGSAAALLRSERTGGFKLSAQMGLMTLETVANGSVVLLNGTEGYIQNGSTGRLKLEGGSADKSVKINGPLQLNRYTNAAAIPALTLNERALAWPNDINRVAIWDGNGWFDIDGRTLSLIKGTTAQRPATLTATNDVGFEYFDTTLGKPVWWKGATWVDATGAAA